VSSVASQLTRHNQTLGQGYSCIVEPCSLRISTKKNSAHDDATEQIYCNLRSTYVEIAIRHLCYRRVSLHYMNEPWHQGFQWRNDNNYMMVLIDAPQTTNSSDFRPPPRRISGSNKLDKA
jgi:hypothetical protein